MVLPASVPVDGTRRVIFINTAANADAVTVVEANAGVELGCYLTGDGWVPAGEQATIVDGRLCSTQDFEQPGRKSKQLSTRYVFNLQNPTDDLARLTLSEGTTGILLNVLQKPEAEGDTITDDDWYEAWPIKAGEQMVMAAEANAVDRIEQKLFVTGEVSKFKQFV